MTDGRKTQAGYGLSRPIKLLHVGGWAVVDTVALPTVAANYFEVLLGVKLRTLLRG
jgi:hypothetical protein